MGDYMIFVFFIIGIIFIACAYFFSKDGYTGPSVEEIAEDMKPDPNYVPDERAIEFGRLVARVMGDE